MTVVGLMESLANNQPWVEDALCAQVGGAGSDSWFPEAGNRNLDAKRVCYGCPVRDACLQYALERNEPYGIWGGYSERERRRMRQGKPAERIYCQRGHEYEKVGRRSDGSCVQCRRDAGRRYEKRSA